MHAICVEINGHARVARSADLSAQSKKHAKFNGFKNCHFAAAKQVLFLLYHYYEARESYNAIRIFIAAYVWMTGFGNFTYYYKTGDFGIGRFAQMMWRLNFLVFFACVVRATLRLPK